MMIYKDLGSTGLKISTLGFGGGIGGVKSKTSNYSGLEITLRKSIDLGVNFIDTSPIYGDGKSEEIIGSSIADIRKDIIIGTKVLPGRTDYKGVMSSVDESLRRLKTDYIDLYQIHWPNPSIPMSETILAMEDLVESGKIRSFGVSNFSYTEIKKASKLLKKSHLASIQVEYNFCERSVEDKILPFCYSNNITPIAYTPLMRGRMAGSRSQISFLKEMSKKYEATIGQIILSWMCKIPSMVVLTNTKNISRASENFSACNVLLTDEDHKHISDACIPPIEMVDTKLILKSSNIEKSGYSSVEEARKNSMNWSPSPVELSIQMIDGEFLKPIRLRKISNSRDNLELLEGKLRFWSWVVAFGWNKKIPAIIWEE
jgi:aryl-alcohol dehydrogenase-like predicted oxidoreductase